MALADEIEKLQQLRQAGTINDDEFARAKSKLLNEPSPSTGFFGSLGGSFANTEQQTNLWACFLHLSMLAGYAVPLAGFVTPILIWQIKKADLPGIDEHGKNATNWIISQVIYTLICVVLFFAVVGGFLLIVLTVLGVVFPIIAGIKASNGEVWKYPLAISFFK